MPAPHERQGMKPRQKPDSIQPIGGSIEGTEFGTAGEEAAAKDIVEIYPRTHNLQEIADRTSWSHSHIRNVFREYFEPAESDLSDHEELVLDEIRDTNVGELTPVDALNRIQEWQDRLRD